MDWLRQIQAPKDVVPAMVIGVPSELRNRLVDYLIQQGFDPVVEDGHSQASAKLKALKKMNALPSFIISGFQCSSGMNAASFLSDKLNLDVPFVAITNAASQNAALEPHKPALCVSEKSLDRLIDPQKVNDEASIEFLGLLEKWRNDALQKAKHP